MFSRPVSSGWKPVPTSSRLPDAAADHGLARGGRRDLRQQLEQRRLAGAVAADDAEHLALLYREGDVLDRPDLLEVLLVLFAEQAAPGMGERVAQGPVAALQLADSIALAEALDVDRCRRSHQSVSAKRGSALRKTASPRTRRTIADAVLTPITCTGRAASNIAQRKPVIAPVIGLSAASHWYFS